MILTSCDLCNLSQVVLYYLRHLIIVLVTSLTVSEECLRILGCTTSERTIGSEGAIAETLHVSFVEQRTDILLVHQLNLMVLMRCTETIEEVNKRNAGLQCCKVSYSSEVHHLLYRTFAQHGETSLAASHHVLMITEDTE